MGRRRKQHGIEVVSALPWPVGIALGLIGFFAVRDGFVWWMGHHGGMLAQGFNQGMGAMLAPLAWLWLVMCCVGALVSFGNRQEHRSKVRKQREERQRLLDTRSDLESLSQGGWRQFELLVGEAFRRQGYAVEETGLGGADGGIDLILRKDGRRTLVQCKQWKRQQVGVSIVREMAGLLAHHRADAVKIVCIGTYTQDAERFAQGKPIELISGTQLLQMIRAAQRDAAVPPAPSLRIEPVLVATPPIATAEPHCPRCGSTLVQRTNRRTGEPFLGCSHFPKCRGTA
ncbi:restriction endonuclease [Pseudoxanthomonas sp. JBR18]|uniref:restriction endonuclease n=1 Tax=Pseudoxanthomonas sp. JBR18 TaxID=2969308 RepID=UPI002306B3A4|nr:restriction endonuclease [Pseudoxanthomonas sp. JBR18]WCE06386.1 restriction endonuclease [Pseudoxanthomonas sp. JBR18]